MNESLYELTGDYLRLKQMAEDPDIDEEVFNDTLESIGDLIELKAEGYAKVIKNLETDRDVILAKANKFKEEFDRHKAEADKIDNHIDRLKRNLAKTMFATDKTKFKTENFSFRAQETVSAIIDDIELVPDMFCKFKKEPNKTEIKKAINTGYDMPGAHLDIKKGVVIR